MKKIISMILAIALMFSMAAPASAAKAAEETYIEITSTSAPLRTGPGKKYEAVATLEKGDCLVMTGWSENRYGNVWYHCQYAGSDDTLYLYSEHAEFHSHTYQEVCEGFSFCHCGRYEIDSCSGAAQTDGLVITAGTLLTDAMAAAAAELTALGGSITTAASGAAVAFPYVCVASVVGLMVYMGVSQSGTQAQVKDVVKAETFEDLWSVFEKDGPEVYYAAAFLPGDIPALLLTSEAMDLEEATDYLSKLANNRGYAYIADLYGKSLLNVWTPLHDSAAILCEKFMKLNKGFVYGNSNADLCLYERDSVKKDWKIQFEHFHLHRMENPFSFIKVRYIHVLFGPPLESRDFV